MASATVFGSIERIVHGRGQIRTLPEEVERLRGSKLLIVTDMGLVKAGIADHVQQLLASYDVEIFRDVEPDPSIETVAACVEHARRSGCDLVVGLGGGSVLDVAKCAAALVKNPGDVREYLGIDQVPNPAVPKIMVPTTAGTGSEVTNVAVLSLKSEKTKKGIVSRHLFADAAILDSELLLGLPAAVTAATGMDALTHAIEAYVSRFAQPLTDRFAIDAITMISASLRTAVFHGADIEARETMLTASLYAGLAFGSAATGMVHGLAMPLGGQFNVAHGIANSVLLPHVMRWNLRSALSRYRDIAVAMGEKVEHLSLREGAERAVSAVEALSRDIGIPVYLDDLDVPRDAIEALARDGMTNERQIRPNPRDVTYDGLVGILEGAFRK